MANDFKPVGPTLDQMNNANKAAWYSGEFKHFDDVRHPPKGGQEVVVNGHVVGHHDDEEHSGMDAGNFYQGEADHPFFEKHPTPAMQHRIDQLKKEKEKLKKPRKNPYGNNEVPTHSNKTSRSGEDAQPEGATSKRANHLPRRANKTWRKPNWDGADSTPQERESRKAERPSISSSTRKFPRVGSPMPNGHGGVVTEGHRAQKAENLRQSRWEKRNPVSRHPENDSKDVRHPPKGGQEVVVNGHVVGHHDDKSADLVEGSEAMPVDDSTPRERTVRKLSNPAKYPNTGSTAHSPGAVVERLANKHKLHVEHPGDPDQPSKAGEAKAEATIGKRIARVGSGKASRAISKGEKHNSLI